MTKARSARAVRASQRKELREVVDVHVESEGVVVSNLQDSIEADHIRDAPGHHVREREDGDALGLVPRNVGGIARDHLEGEGGESDPSNDRHPLLGQEWGEVPEISDAAHGVHALRTRKSGQHLK